jgi:hypothetical protein
VAVGLERPIPAWEPLDPTVARIREAGGLSILPHPFFRHLRERTDVDGIEQFNARYGDFSLNGTIVARVGDTLYETVGRVRGPRLGDPVTRDDVLTKFRKMTQRFWSESTQNRAIDLCDSLDTLDDTSELLSLLQIEHLPPLDMGGE